MQYKYYDFDLNVSNVVIVHLDKRANVRLMDDINYLHFKNGRQFRYIGGEAVRTPVHLRPTHTGHWYLIIDLGTRGGILKHRVEIA